METTIRGFTYNYDGETVDDIADDIAGDMEQTIGCIADIMDYAIEPDTVNYHDGSTVANAAFHIRSLIERDAEAFAIVGRCIAEHPERFVSYAEVGDYPGILEPILHLLERGRA